VEPPGCLLAVPTRSRRAGDGALRRVMTVNVPAKITCAHSMQQTRSECWKGEDREEEAFTRGSWDAGGCRRGSGGDCRPGGRGAGRADGSEQL
jgi:hypothetical protein